MLYMWYIWLWFGWLAGCEYFWYCCACMLLPSISWLSYLISRIFLHLEDGSYPMVSLYATWWCTLVFNMRLIGRWILGLSIHEEFGYEVPFGSSSLSSQAFCSPGWCTEITTVISVRPSLNDNRHHAPRYIRVWLNKILWTYETFVSYFWVKYCTPARNT